MIKNAQAYDKKVFINKFKKYNYSREGKYMQKDSPEKLSKTTIILHWIVGLSMIGLLTVGTVMAQFKLYFLYPLHKSFGVIILAVIIMRVIWRMMNGWPESNIEYKQWEKILSHIVHWVLILGTLALPISGMMMSGAGGHGIEVFGLELLASNPDPMNPQQMMPLNEGAAKLGKRIHDIGGKVLIAAVLLHIAGAVKHHVMDKQATLKRMLGMS